MKKEEKLLFIFGVLLLFAAVMLLIQNIKIPETKITGYATEESTVSNVTITKYLSIDLSTNLSDGILFGSITNLPATDENASHNYDVGGTNSSMYANVSADSNTAVDFCIKANADLTSAASDVIGIGNESYANSTVTNISNPDLANQVSLTTSYVKAGDNISIGGDNYYRLWLDVPSGQASGTYNNTITFKGIEVTTSC